MIGVLQKAFVMLAFIDWGIEFELQLYETLVGLHIFYKSTLFTGTIYIIFKEALAPPHLTQSH